MKENGYNIEIGGNYRWNKMACNTPLSQGAYWVSISVLALHTFDTEEKHQNERMEAFKLLPFAV